MINIEEGIFLLWNAQNGEALDLKNGAWKYGQLQTREGPPGVRDSVSQHNRRWIIAKVPNTDNEYQIINAHYGVLAGSFGSESNGNWLVKAGPISTDGQSARWIAEDAGSKLVQFKWKMNPSRCLDIDQGRSRGAAKILPIVQDAKSQMWRLERDDVLDAPSNKWSGWMSNVPDRTKLSMMNIPTTHQSLATHRIWISDNPRCQDRPVYEQLCEGIRGLDNRFDRWDDGKEQWSLYARHGIAKMGYSCAAVLQSLKIFLQRFPQEFVIMNVRNESGTDGFRESWENDYKWFKDIFYDDGNSEMPRMADLTIGQVRGKVICTDLIWNSGSFYGKGPA